MPSRIRAALIGVALLGVVATHAARGEIVAPGGQTTPVKTAFLGFRFIPNAEPITSDETARLFKIGEHLKKRLQAAKTYDFVPISDALRAKIASGQSVGECGGCEIDYGKEAGAPIVMWGTVQKVSNLILNLNIYMADVRENKMVFVKSVDMRGNTDETWDQALNYMLKRYILKIPGGQKDK